MSTGLPEQLPDPEEDHSDPPTRRHTTREELAILTVAILRFYSESERSPERAAIQKETVALLQMMDGRWTARHVRLWFSNNRQTYCVGPCLGDSSPKFDRPVRLSDLRELEAGLEQLLTRLLTDRDMAELPAPPPDASLKRSTALYVVRGNLPLSHPRHPAFRRYLGELLSGPQVPGVSLVRQEILRLACEFRDKVVTAAGGFHFVHIMADTARVRGRNWLGVCLVTLDRFLPWAVLEIPNQTSVAIAEALALVIGNLRDHGLSTCSVVTDNAQSEVKAVKILWSRYSVFRVPCLSHTANLVIGDLFAALYPDWDVFQDLGYVIGVLTRPGPGGPFHGCPTLTPTRWFCLWDFFTYVVRRYDEIGEFLAHTVPVRGKVHPFVVFRRYDFGAILPFLGLVGSFIKWSECEDSTLGTAWALVLQVRDTLLGGAVEGRPHAREFLRCFTSRLTKTADVGGMLLAYLMTRSGLDWYRALSHEAVGSCQLTPVAVDELTEPVRRWYVEFAGCDRDVFEGTWVWYLRNAEFGDLGNLSFWRRFRGNMVTLEGRTRPVLCDSLGTLGMILAIMPVSESGVERIFSHLRDLLLPHRDRMDAELVQARLVIKLNHYPDEEACEERLRHLDGVGWEDPWHSLAFPFGVPSPDPSPIPGPAPQ
jgi:hypothetical protein